MKPGSLLPRDVVSGSDFNHRRYTTTPSPKPPPPTLPTPHGRRRRYCCYCCCCAAAAIVLWLRLVSPAFVLNKTNKNGCSVDAVIVVIEPGRAEPQLIGRGHRHRHLRPCPRRCCCCCGGGCCDATAQQLLLLRCCLSDRVVPGLPLSMSQ